MSKIIATNKQARFSYHLKDAFEAGVVLKGWEVKSLRSKQCQLQDAYVVSKQGELWLLNAVITPLATVSTHITPEPGRSRKLLLHKHQIATIQGALSRKGMTCVAESLYWKDQRVKCHVRLAVGKKLHDKRSTIKDREWSIVKERLHKVRHVSAPV